MKIITANNGNKFEFSDNSWKLIKKSTTEPDYPETTARLRGLNVEVKWVGEYHRATMIDPAEYPEAEIIGLELDDEGEFYDNIYNDTIEAEIAENIRIHYDQFGIHPNYIEFLLDGAKYVLKTPTSDPTDAEPISIEIVDEKSFLNEFPWEEEVREHMARSGGVLMVKIIKLAEGKVIMAKKKAPVFKPVPPFMRSMPYASNKKTIRMTQQQDWYKKIQEEEEHDLYERFYEQEDEALRDVLGEFVSSKPNEKQPWELVPFNRVRKIWSDYMQYGIVRDVRGIDQIADRMIRNVHRLAANTYLMGHTERDPDEHFEEYSIDEKAKERFWDSYAIEEGGQARISDFALDKLQNDALELMKARSAEEKLQIIDRMFNRIHQRSDLPAMFIEGGTDSLNKLFGVRPNVEAFNLRKHKKAQKDFGYYTIEVATNPRTSPEILTKVLRRGNDDLVSRYAAENPNCPPEILTEILKRGNNDGVSWDAASNPNCPTEILTEILRRGNNDIVSQYAAYNPNTPPEILTAILRRGNNNIVSYNAARNPNMPPEILIEILRRGNDDTGLARSAAINPNVPKEILIEILRRGNDDAASWGAASNPNCPPEILAEVLKRKIDDGVSQYAAENSNTSPEALIKWMKATGRIGKEDPSKGHIVEYDSKEEVDEDLEKLRKMVSNNRDDLNWYKKAQEKIPNPENAINSIKALGFINPLNSRQVVIDKVKVEISIYDDNSIWLKSIESIEPRKGKGTFVLNNIIDIANNNNVAIYLDPMPFGEISNKNLIEWYKKHGFIRGLEDNFKHGLVHYPNRS